MQGTVDRLRPIGREVSLIRPALLSQLTRLGRRLLHTRTLAVNHPRIAIGCHLDSWNSPAQSSQEHPDLVDHHRIGRCTDNLNNPVHARHPAKPLCSPSPTEEEHREYRGAQEI